MGLLDLQERLALLTLPGMWLMNGSKEFTKMRDKELSLQVIHKNIPNIPTRCTYTTVTVASHTERVTKSIHHKLNKLLHFSICLSGAFCVRNKIFAKSWWRTQLTVFEPLKNAQKVLRQQRYRQIPHATHRRGTVGYQRSLLETINELFSAALLWGSMLVSIVMSNAVHVT